MRHQQRLLCTSSGKRHQYYFSSYTATVLHQYCHVEVELRGPSKTPAEASVQGNGTSTLCTEFQCISILYTASRAAAIVRLTRSLLDPELFPHTAYVKILATLARKTVN